MKALARLGVASVVLTYLHLVFGGIVRITGSGMGCGDHWPKCNGSWIPPFENPTVLIEYVHRLLALLVVLSLVALAALAYRRRAQPGVGGRGGVLPASVAALVLVIGVALLGMVTVKLGNRPAATVTHWTFAMALLAVVTATTIRAGAMGGAAAQIERGSARATRSIGAAAALALVAVVLGGVVAKSPGAAVACPSFPLCGSTPATVSRSAARLHFAHRFVAYLLFLHVLAISAAVGRRAAESETVKRALKIGVGFVLLQLGIGAAMVLSLLPPFLRSAHEAVGIAVWLALFSSGYLARTAAVGSGLSAAGEAPARAEPITHGA